MTAKMDYKKDELLPQDLTEGVDSDEWVYKHFLKIQIFKTISLSCFNHYV